VLNSDGSVITALWARQCGKTETVANVCVGLAVILPALAQQFPDDPRFMPFKDGFLVGVYAPIDAQAKISFGRMRDVVTSEHGQEVLSDPDIDVDLVTNRSDVLGFSNGSRILAKSASPETQIEGDTHHLVICEESQRLLRAKVDKEISPMLASTNGTMVKIGTAWHSRGGFHVSIQQNLEIRRKGGPRNHFEFPYEIVIAEKRRMYDHEKATKGVGDPFHLNYEAFIAKEIQRLGGVDSEEFKMNYRCLWQESRIIAINMRKFSDAALLRAECGRARGGFQVAGLDIGKTIDATVLTIGMVDKDRPIVNTRYMPGSDEDKQFYYQKTIIDWL
jgi:phage terminase large subunit-like protein